MFLSKFSKEAPIKELQIDSSVHKLYLWMEFTFDELKNNNNPGNAIVKELDKIKVSLQRQTPNGAEHILMPTGLGVLGEISSNKEGHIGVKAYLGKAGCNVDVAFQVSPASLVAGSGEFLLLTVDTSEFEKADLNGEVYAVELPNQTTVHTEYKQHKANANTTKVLSMSGVDILSLPKKNFQQLDVVYPERTITFKGDIQCVMRSVENLILNCMVMHTYFVDGQQSSETAEANPKPLLTFSNSQTYFDSVENYTLGVNGALEVRVLYSEDSPIYTVSNI